MHAELLDDTKEPSWNRPNGGNNDPNLAQLLDDAGELKWTKSTTKKRKPIFPTPRTEVDKPGSARILNNDDEPT